MVRLEAFQKAEQRIKAARKTGATELDLSYLRLTEVPEAIAALTQLQSLNLSGNRLTALPEAIAALTQLRTLDLCYNPLTKLPEAIAGLTQLQTLYLRNNRLTAIPEAIAGLTQLRTLDLRNNQLRELPEAIVALTQLQKLNLSSNQLTKLPEAIAALTQLQELNLSRNPLTKLPETIAALTQLRKLNLHHNQLIKLPEAIASLTQLKSLDLSHNYLIKLPEEIDSLTQLQSLALSDNHLRELPETIASLTQLQSLYLSGNHLRELPETIASLTQLQSLALSRNQLTKLPEAIAALTQLQEFYLYGNQLRELPEGIAELTQLQKLNLFNNQLTELPGSLSSLTQLRKLNLSNNQLTELPESLASLPELQSLNLDDNPLNPDLAAAYDQGIEAVMQYLQAKAEAEVTLHEAKLILVGEGEVGKSCLLGALRGDKWVEGRPTTHGIEIKPVRVTAPNNTEITLNGWDFGGQRVYRPTHQLFFSSPAVYLVVWKPREGPQQGFVREWIALIKHREPDAKVLVVATHGGPGQRQPDIDRQELIDRFGSDTLVGFFHIDSKPNPETQCCTGIAELRDAIAQTAATLPEMGRSVPAKWQRTREILQASDRAYLPYHDVIRLCAEQGIDEPQAELFLLISHTLGHLTHYHYDPTLSDIVILKPDWLAKAISYVLDDETTRRRNGLVEFDHLSQLWSHPPFPGETGYPKALHPVFLRLMERFDLSYKVILDPTQLGTTSLIAQLVPDHRPTQFPHWGKQPEAGDRQQVQICRIVDDRGQLANAEGLFYQLIVRLHKYSLGRAKYEDSIHWQRGLMLDNDYNGRALLELIGTDVKITVRAAYPERFLSHLTEEVKWLVEHFWEGLRCNVMVPCLEPCGQNSAGRGLFEVQKLIESKKKNRPDFPCPVSGCDEWHNIDRLLYNAPLPQLPDRGELSEQMTDIAATLQVIRQELRIKDRCDERRYQDLSKQQLAAMSKADEQFAGLMQTLVDEAKDGPRLFSFKPIDPGFFDRPKWLSAKFQITLWCEHARLPLPALNPSGSTQGIYELELPRKWLVNSAPLLQTISLTLGLMLPIVGSTAKMMLDDTTYKGIETEIEFGQKIMEVVNKSSKLVTAWQSECNRLELEYGDAICASGSMLRELQTLLKAKDPSFGGLAKVQNKRREFLWIHPQFIDEY